MPPWKPEPGFGEFVGSRRLNDEQIALFQRWVAEGMAEGDPAATPPAPVFSSAWRLGEPDLVAHDGAAVHGSPPRATTSTGIS